MRDGRRGPRPRAPGEQVVRTRSAGRRARVHVVSTLSPRLP